jgi:6-phosphogluconate dehydrogenase
MQLEMIGLGRMSVNLMRHSIRGGHECVVYHVKTDAVPALRAAWIMGPNTAMEEPCETRARTWRQETW